MAKLNFETTSCVRCGGTGFIEAFGHVFGGRCFKCAGSGSTLTPAGRSARKLYEELLDTACARKQAWEVEAGERVSYAGKNQFFRVLSKDFSSQAGGVVGGRCEGSAMLESAKSMHMVAPYTEMKVAPSSERLIAIMHEVAKRRKGATVTEG